MVKLKANKIQPGPISVKLRVPSLTGYNLRRKGSNFNKLKVKK